MVLRQIFPCLLEFPWWFKALQELHPYAVQVLNFHFAGSRKKSKEDLVWGSSNESKMFSSECSEV